MNKERERVCFVISSFEAGGAERVFSVLINNFDYETYDVYVIVLDNRNQFFLLDTKKVVFKDLKINRAYKSTFKLAKEILRIDPKVVFCTGTHLNILIGFLRYFFNRDMRFIARQSNIPNKINKYSSLKTKVINYFIKGIYKNFDFIVCQSAEMKSSLKNHYGLAVKKLVVINNPIMSFEEPQRVFVKSNIVRLINIGRLNPVKGQSRLIDAFSNLNNNYELSIYGDGSEKEKLLTQIQLLGLYDKIKLHPSNKEIISEILKHDLLIISSFTEGFPNVALEALSVGIPVISFEVGGIREIIKDGFNGFVVPQGDLNELTNAIRRSKDISWDHERIIEDVNKRFGVPSILNSYYELIR